MTWTDAEFCAPTRGNQRARPIKRERRLRRGRRPRIAISEAKARIAAIKMERGCMDCGFRAHPAALDFDHVQGRKISAISQMNAGCWAAVLSEIAKCEVVCANCHRIRHAERRKTAAIPPES